jgi:hypothetical protein
MHNPLILPTLANTMRLPELEDFSWFPQWMRTHQMEFLRFMADQFGLYSPVLPGLEKLLSKNPNTRWYDACSGQGGPVSWLCQHLNHQGKVYLTDLYPQQPDGLPKNLIFQQEPVRLPENLPGENGLISFFNSFHHFSIAEQKIILQKAAAAKRPIVIAEIVQPTGLSALSVLVSTTIGQLLFAPFIRPFLWERLLFTYLLPIHIVTTLHDGLVSVSRSGSQQRFTALANELNMPDYHFHFEKKAGSFAMVYIFTGEPVIIPSSKDSDI